ncbi:MAG: cytochrome c oxidase subunit II [Candidatus Latescibacterota bacterium]|nr:MAG: cytochrome c oxidase subunit II [Candidatus Latescibacterota bacterium]
MDLFSSTTEAVNIAFFVTLGIAVGMLVLITVLMVVFVIKYHRKRHPKASQVKGHTLLEIVWTVVPTLLALGMFYLGWVGYKFMRAVPEGAIEVSATGRMWSWEFEYENGKRSPELYVPVDRPVKVNLKSADVLHSFYVPAYRVKQDVVPGLDTYVWFHPVDTGLYDIFCAEYCGQRHSYMMSKVVVIPAAEFQDWVEQDVESVPVVSDEATSDQEQVERLRRAGERLSKIKGCNACHSTDGSELVGPTYKGLFGRAGVVITDGEKRQIVVDEEYLRKSILEPSADIVEGYGPVMPSQQGITEEEVNAIVEYLKTL